MAHSARPVPRRMLAAATLLAATLALTTGQSGSPPRPDDAPGSAGGPEAKASWARTVTGALVAVTPTHEATPIHPEALTHPDLDTMNATAERGPAMMLAAATKPIPGTAGRRSAGGRGQGVVPNPISPYSSIPKLPGIDVSSHQGDIDWARVAPHVDFVYTKATEGTYYRNAYFENQYEGPYHYGVIRGAYHFAVPDNSSGTAQADYFIAHGGGWSADGLTLPGALDIEYNPYGAECYGLTTSQMVSWIRNFVTEYAAREHAYPVIYTTTGWWKACTGDSGAFTSLDPVWVPNYTPAGAGPMPGDWGFYTFWQYADSGSQPGDQDVFNGAYKQLKTLAERG
jgi:GH25 family lysozyme M1 (1,4-beta-N-acetylmuramidase)